MNGWNGLNAAPRTLPTEWYVDAERYRRELDTVWYRNWIYLCRADAVPEPLAYRVLPLGERRILLLRREDGSLRAFHNSCRHRGAELCPATEGRLSIPRLVCPYHMWSYDLDGALRRVPAPNGPPPFDLADFPLQPVALAEWNGFVFANLAPEPRPFGSGFDSPLDRLDRWPMNDLAVAHALTRTIACNWKVFWENYNECLHCPKVHPALSALVPIFGRAIMEPQDDRDWARHAGSDDPRHRGGLRPGAVTWSTDGQPVAPPFPGLAEADLRAGQVYVTALPSFFAVAHSDHLRVVRLLPQGPEAIELHVEWLFSKTALAQGKADPARAVRFAETVLDEDAAICEVNQRGLRAAPQESGVLMPEEYAVHQFHEWVRRETGG